MKLWLIICVFFCCLAGMAAQETRGAVRKQDQELAEKDFRRAQELQKSNQTKEALEAATTATDLVPNEAKYLALRELLSQQLAAKYLADLRVPQLLRA